MTILKWVIEREDMDEGRTLLKQALAAERRATVERIRAALNLHLESSGEVNVRRVRAILDEEAARDTQLSQPDGKVRP